MSHDFSGGAGHNVPMHWSKHMPKFDWSKERPHWKLAAWLILLLPSILIALSVLAKALK